MADSTQELWRATDELLALTTGQIVAKGRERWGDKAWYEVSESILSTVNRFVLLEMIGASYSYRLAVTATWNLLQDLEKTK